MEEHCFFAGIKRKTGERFQAVQASQYLISVFLELVRLVYIFTIIPITTVDRCTFLSTTTAKARCELAKLAYRRWSVLRLQMSFLKAISGMVRVVDIVLFAQCKVCSFINLFLFSSKLWWVSAQSVQLFYRNITFYLGICIYFYRRKDSQL